MRLIPLTRGLFAKVDDDDFRSLSKFKWCASQSGKTNTLYATRTACVDGKRRSVRMHNVIMGNPAGTVVDHINHDSLDNQRWNLRTCTHQENTRNRCGAQKNSRSAVRGVYWDRKRKKFFVHIRVNGKQLNLGRYVNKNEAANAYAEANKKHFGAFGGSMEKTHETTGQS